MRTAVVVTGAFAALAWGSVSPVQVLAAAALVGAFWTGEETP